MRNILENPQAAFVADRWDEDWTRLGWVMLRGAAEILESGAEHDRAQALLAARYPQYRAMQVADLPVIVVRVSQATDWGNWSFESAPATGAKSDHDILSAPCAYRGGAWQGRRACAHRRKPAASCG